MANPKFVLEMTEGPNAGTCYSLAGETALIGRAAECDIRLDDVRGVSRTHCRLYVMDNGLRIQDLGSQNGTVIQNKRITDAIVKPGISFRIGEASFLVHDAETLRNQFAPAPTGDNVPEAIAVNAMATTSGKGLAPAPGMSTGIDQAQELLEAAGEGSKKVLWQFAVLIGIVVAGLYFLQLVSRESVYDPVFALVKAYEPKAVNFNVNFEGFAVEGKSAGMPVIRAEEYNGLLKPSLDRLLKNPVALRRRMLIVEGIAEGDAWIILRNKDQQPFSRFRIVCRGVNPYYIPPDFPADKAKALANQYLAEGQFFEKEGKLYDAWRHFEQAATLFDGPAKNPKLGADTKLLALDLRGQLANQLCRRFDDAMATAFPPQANVRVASISQALQILEEARNMIPDEKSVDRQIIENWMAVLTAYKTRRR